ncbi:cytochrome ubiquinol oxidase subunit II [Solirhodobacter olei]|uniref:cytochrome ubiquinol oxidase subunit II n=1 Tax=Solirhodobacter olei TaxID=2493082 RepID=UPI001F4EB8C0|nr:cytochrome ubiquinol oxidase subunit II [Solirhodobacter olei]
MFRLRREPAVFRLREALRPLKLLGLAVPTLLGGCAMNGVTFMAPEGPIAAMQRYHFWQVTAISMIVVLPVLIGVPILIWRYRYGNTKARYTPHWDFSHSLEWLMWLVPAAIVLVLGAILWIDTHELDPYKPLASTKPPLQVEVVGLDWKWLFIYPEYHIATVGEMAIPKDRPVSLKLTTDTVMQSFMISALAGQIYAMPGMVTKMHLIADRVGHYDGDNTQYSGEGFHGQHFTAVSMGKGDFDAWVKKAQTFGTALNPMAYNRLAVSSTPAQVRATFGNTAMPPHVTFFNDVPSGFFKKIVMRYHHGKPVPADQQPGTAAYNAKYSG